MKKAKPALSRSPSRTSAEEELKTEKQEKEQQKISKEAGPYVYYIQLPNTFCYSHGRYVYLQCRYPCNPYILFNFVRHTEKSKKNEGKKAETTKRTSSKNDTKRPRDSDDEENNR